MRDRPSCNLASLQGGVLKIFGSLVWKGVLGLLVTAVPLMGDLITLNENPVNYNDLLLNEVRRTVNVQINVNDPIVQIQIYLPEISATNQALIDDLDIADITMTAESEIKTLTEIREAKTFDITATITTKPNPDATGGYKVLMQLQTLRLNYNIEDIHFFKFQSVPLQDTFISVVNPDFVYLDLKLGAVVVDSWIGFADGMAISETWTALPWFVVDDTYGSDSTVSKQVTISIPYDYFFTIAGEEVTPVLDGTYWFTIESIMQPYTPPTISEDVTDLSELIEQQIIFRNQLINDIDTLLQDTTTLDRFRPGEIAVLTANKTTLQTQIEEISEEVEAYFTGLANSASATDADKQLITEKKAEIAALAAVYT